MVTAFPELPPPTDRFSDLTEPEQLVVCAFRCWLAGGHQREMLWRVLAHDLEPGAARTALKGLEAMIRVLTAHAHRNISYHQPCCPCVGPDEVALLTLVTAVQRAAAARETRRQQLRSRTRPERAARRGGYVRLGPETRRARAPAPLRLLRRARGRA